MGVKARSDNRQEQGAETGVEAAQADSALAGVVAPENKPAIQQSTQHDVHVRLQVALLVKQQQEALADPQRAAEIASDIEKQGIEALQKDLFENNPKLNQEHLTKLLFGSGGHLEGSPSTNISIEVDKDDLLAAQVAIEGFLLIHMLSSGYKMKSSKHGTRYLLGDSEDPHLDMIRHVRQTDLGESLLESDFEAKFKDPKTQEIVDQIRKAMPETWLDKVDGDVLMIAMYRQEKGHSMTEFIMAFQSPEADEGLEVIKIRAKERSAQAAAA
jgi:hypothetical protein